AQRQFALALMACAHIRRELPMPRYWDGHIRARAETVQSQLSVRLDRGNRQRAKSDDAGAQKRRRLRIGEARRNGISKLLVADNVFGVTTVDRVAGKFRTVAKIFFSLPAVLANPASAVQPGDANS